jgi:hypothetical protein
VQVRELVAANCSYSSVTHEAWRMSKIQHGG